MATVKLDPAKGVQIPNMTTTERNAVSSPETGALVWNTTTSAINQYNGSAWKEILRSDGSAASLTAIPAANITGTLPALSAANLTAIPAGNLTGTVADARISALTSSKLTGALPAISAANLTAIPAANITGTLPAISGANLTGLASPAITKVTEAYSSSTRSAFSYSRDLFANNLDFVGWKVGFSFTKASGSTDILIHFSMSVADFKSCWSTAIYTGSNGSASNMTRWAFAGHEAIGEELPRAGVIVSGHVVKTGLSSGGQQWYWAMGRKNDAYNSSYTLNPDTSDYAQYGGATTSTIMVYEGDFS